MRYLTLIPCLLAFGLPALAQSTLRETPERVLFGNRHLQLQFDRATGAWVGLIDKVSGDNLIGNDDLHAPVDFQADNALVCSANVKPQLGADAQDLAGRWDFRIDPEGVGDKGGWQRGVPERRDNDPRRTRALSVPGYWESQGVTDTFPSSPEPTWTPYNGDAWYQREVDVPAAWAGGDLQISIGAVDDFDWVYFNGEFVGHTGQDTADWWAARRLYTVPARMVKPGAKNRIVIHVYDRGGDGGIVGPVMIGRAGKLPKQGAWEPCGLTLVSRAVEGNTLSITCRAGDWLVTTTYELLDSTPVVRRGLKLKYEGKGPSRLGTAQWIVPDVRIGQAADCEIRGPQFDNPVTPFTAMAEGGWHEDSMGGGGAWSAVYNRKQKRAVVCSFIARTEGHSSWAREGKGEASLGSNLDTADIAKPGQEYDLGTQYVSIRRGEWSQCLTAVRDMFRLHGFVARPNAPKWAQRAIIYTMYPGGTMESSLNDTGGFQNVTKYTLPRIQELGCNTLWFLPICPGLYGPADYYAIEPRIGTEADLHDCVAAAKQRNINVLLDLVPHGPQTSSPIGTEHPDWVAKDEKGKPALWWGCIYCDYANPGWQKYMGDLARYFVEKDGIKGWRVDCAPGGPANWDPARKVRASMSSLYGGLEVLRSAKQSMAQVDKETILLPEGTGPMLLENADIVYDYNLYFGILKHFTDAESPDVWCKKTSWWLEQQRLSWPEGGCFGLMRFLENHDNVRYWRYAGLGPSRALMTLCVWIQGVPLYHHLQEVGSSDEFTKVNRLRQQVDELNTGTARYMAAVADKPGIFTCLREDGEKKALVAINLTGADVDTTISLPGDALPKGERLVAYDAWSGGYANTGGKAGCAREALRKVKVRLAAYEPALVLLRPVGAQLPTLQWPGTQVADGIPSTNRTVSADARNVSLSTGRLGLHVQDGGGGLPSAITVDGSNLLEAVDLAEGREKPLGPGKGLALMRTGQAKVTATREPAPAISAEGSVLRGNLGGKELRLPYRVAYRVVGPDNVSVKIGFQMPETVKRTTGALNLELAFQGVDRWAVDTIEGRLEDSVTRFHPVPGDYSGGWLQHPTGDRLWENSTLPLDPQSPCIGVRSADSKHWLNLSAFQASPELPIDNIYLRETRGADRKELGPTLVVAWIDGKGPRDLIAGHWYELSFHLSGAYRTPTPERQTVSLRADGGNYVIENQHYRLIVGKSGGGVIRSFTSKKTGWQAITGSDTYTDAGFYEKANNEGGQYGSAADWPDLEPEVSYQRDGDRLMLTVTGKLHGSNWNWAFAASPSIEYRKTFICDASDTVRCEVAVKPFARQQMKGFLAHRMEFSAMSEWSATGAKGPLGGKPGGPSERTWQSRTAPLRNEAPVIGFTGSKGESLLISGIDMTPKAQDMFIHQSGTSPNLFFAWYDFDPTDVPTAWHILKYELRIAPTPHRFG